MKGFHIRGLLVGSVRQTYMDWRGKRMCCVVQVTPVGCTSIRITVTLGYEKLLVCGCHQVVISWINDYCWVMELFYFNTCIATLVWLSLVLPMLKFD
jgi:hypothetical protein